MSMLTPVKRRTPLLVSGVTLAVPPFPPSPRFLSPTRRRTPLLVAGNVGAAAFVQAAPALVVKPIAARAKAGRVYIGARPLVSTPFVGAPRALIVKPLPSRRTPVRVLIGRTFAVSAAALINQRRERLNICLYI